MLPNTKEVEPNPITHLDDQVAELHKIRDKVAKDCDYDIHKVAAFFKQFEPQGQAKPYGIRDGRSVSYVERPHH